MCLSFAYAQGTFTVDRTTVKADLGLLAAFKIGCKLPDLPLDIFG
jgi:hypothetical protein